jgi:hypothetical protein
MDDVTAVHQEAEQALASGDGDRAFTTLRPVLERADQLEAPDWSAAFTLFARISTDLSGGALAEMAQLAQTAARDGTDATTLYELGYALIEQGLYGVAASVLERANRLLPGDEHIVNELVVALEGRDDHAGIRALVNDNPKLLRRHFRYRYALTRHTILDGDLTEARRLARRLRPGFRGNQRTMASQITAMLARADAVSGVCVLDGDDLRGWHFVITGGLLLHVSPYGFDQMRGRYAYTTDAEDRCLEALHRLGAVLDVSGMPAQVVGLPDRNSAALAIAAARHLGQRMTALDETTLDAPGLLVAYDLDHVDDPLLHALSAHRPGQMLWMHAAQWTVEQPVAADLTTYLHQVNVGPWDEGRLRIDQDTDEAIREPAVEGAPEQLAERVLGAELQPEALADLPDLVALARAARTAAAEGMPAALRTEGWRSPQWTGGPVRSNWFH